VSKLVITVASNPTATEYLERSVREGIAYERVAEHPAATSILSLLREHIDDGRVRMWGSVAGAQDRHLATWNRIDPGDWLAFSIGGRFRLAARIYARLNSPELADAIWPPDGEAGSYQYMSFFDALTPIDVSARSMSDALGYGASYIYRGFSVPSAEAQAHVVSRNGGVESFLNVLAGELAVVSTLAEGAPGPNYVSALSEFDTDEAGARLEDGLRELMKNGPPDLAEALIRRAKRDRKLVQKLKELYAGECQRCTFTFTKADGKRYAEGAHINRIADRLPGIDSPDNIVVLCANCHRLLDYGTLEIAWDDSAGALVSRLDGETAVMVNKHVRRAWAPAGEWSSASQRDADW
jgi:hypothetical protein